MTKQFIRRKSGLREVVARFFDFRGWLLSSVFIRPVVVEHKPNEKACFWQLIDLSRRRRPLRHRGLCNIG